MALLGGAREAAAAGMACPSLAGGPARRWSAPLDKAVSIHARDIALRAALDHLSAVSHVALAYSPDLVALDRRVCVIASDRPLGEVLTSLLDGSGVHPTVVAGQVVLGPLTDAATASRGAGVDVLERVVVTGNPVATARRPLTIGVEVIDGERLRRQSMSSLAEMLDAGVAGAWVWSASPGSLVAQYAGIRGASSFGSAAPKIYVDGIEVANPLIMTQVDPELVDHIEVIRGPQGSALYGSDAISGVVNVVTRHEGAAVRGARVLLSSMAGASSSAFGSSLVPTHEQRLALRTGTNVRSAGLSAQFGQTGAIVPAVNSRDVSLAADARTVGRLATWSGSARYVDRQAGSGQNPLLRGLTPVSQAPDSAADVATRSDVAPQSARQYTVGSMLHRATAGPFTHSFLVGVDGYRLDNVVASGLLYPVPADSSLRATQGSGDRTTIRLSSTGRFGDADGAPVTTVAFGIDQSVLRQRGITTTVSAPTAGTRYPVSRDARAEQWNHNAGIFTQVSTAWRDALFMSAGVRIERNDAFTGDDRHPILPMLGVASVHEIGPASLKLRAAYGKGIRPPSASARGTLAVRGAGAPTTALDPEAQAGTEVGAELYVGRTASLQLTRFDQVASGLVQNVLVGVDTQMRSGRVVRHMIFQLQNVGEIGNHGWEVQGTLAHGAASLTSALTLVDSRVRAVARGYGGDLRAGDRMLGVPARAGSVTASWNPSAWSAALSVSRAGQWINYDRLSLARDYAAAGSAAHEIAGAKLRRYWKDYTGSTHVRLSGTRALSDALELLLVGDNLVGGQLGEPDNVTIRAGRTITAGLRAGF